MSEGTVLDALAQAVRRSAEHAKSAERAPAAILWPDQAGHWREAARQLRDTLSIVELGPYRPDDRTGPAYWVRCIVDGTLPLPVDGTPIVYMPGYARSDIRAVEDAHPELKPLAELQYRGAIFSQKSGRDWTLLAFLQAAEARGGLGLDVASDEGTKAALLRAADRVLAEPVDRLRRAAPLKAKHFDALMTPDIERDVLRWLDDPAGYRASLSTEQWASFRAQFAETFGMDLDAGEVAVAGALGARTSQEWDRVWRAFADAPGRYPGVPERLRAARPKLKKAQETPGLWDARGTWPQDNEEAEDALRQRLLRLDGGSPEAARATVRELDSVAGERRGWVWAALGSAPLAFACEHLAALAKETESHMAPGSVESITESYVSGRWRADDAVMRAIAAVESVEDASAVGVAIRTIYMPWLEVAAERLAGAVRDDPASYVSPAPTSWPPGTCVIFTDGMRFDLGIRLAAALERAGLEATVEPRLTALPSITPTAKPAVTPAVARLRAGGVFGVPLAHVNIRKCSERTKVDALSLMNRGIAWSRFDPGREVVDRRDVVVRQQGARQCKRVEPLVRGAFQGAVVQVETVDVHAHPAAGWRAHDVRSRCGSHLASLLDMCPRVGLRCLHPLSSLRRLSARPPKGGLVWF